MIRLSSRRYPDLNVYVGRMSKVLRILTHRKKKTILDFFFFMGLTRFLVQDFYFQINPYTHVYVRARARGVYIYIYIHYLRLNKKS